MNAARNILAKGLERARAETEPLPVMRIGKFGQGSTKPTAFRGGFTKLRELSPLTLRTPSQVIQFLL